MNSLNFAISQISSQIKECTFSKFSLMISLTWKLFKRSNNTSRIYQTSSKSQKNTCKTKDLTRISRFVWLIFSVLSSFLPSMTRLKMLRLSSTNKNKKSFLVNFMSGSIKKVNNSSKTTYFKYSISSFARYTSKIIFTT